MLAAPHDRTKRARGHAVAHQVAAHGLDGGRRRGGAHNGNLARPGARRQDGRPGANAACGRGGLHPVRPQSEGVHPATLHDAHAASFASGPQGRQNRGRIHQRIFRIEGARHARHPQPGHGRGHRPPVQRFRRNAERRLRAAAVYQDRPLFGISRQFRGARCAVVDGGTAFGLQFLHESGVQGEALQGERHPRRRAFHLAAGREHTGPGPTRLTPEGARIHERQSRVPVWARRQAVEAPMIPAPITSVSHDAKGTFSYGTGAKIERLCCIVSFFTMKKSARLRITSSPPARSD